MHRNRGERLYDYQEQERLRAPQGAGPNIARGVPGLNMGATAQDKQLAGLLDAAQGLLGVGVGVYRDVEATRAVDAVNKYRQALSEEHVRYTAENQGENALDARGHFKSFSEQKAQEIADSLGSGPARDSFLRHAVAPALHFTEQGAAYGAHQKQAWQKSVIQGSEDAFLQAVAQDPYNREYMANQFYSQVAAFQAAHPGLDARAYAADLQRKAVNARFAALASAGDFSAIEQELGYNASHSRAGGNPGMAGEGSGGGNGQPRGLRNNNPGNIVKTGSAWEGEVDGGDEKFKSFTTPEHGIAAMGKNLLNYDKKGINTVAAIIERWAPPSENDTGAYVSTVAKALGVAPDAKLDLKDPDILKALSAAIIKHENGKQPYSAEQLDAGIGAALGKRQLPPGGKLVADAGRTVTDASFSHSRAGGNPVEDSGTPGPASSPSRLAGILPPSELLHWQHTIKSEKEKAVIQNAFSAVSALPAQAAIETLNNPQGWQRLGINPVQAEKVLGMYKTHFEHVKQIEKQQREDYEIKAMTGAVNLALGAGGVPADPVAAYKMIQDDPTLDGKTKLQSLAALENGTMGKKDDPVFLSEVQSRIASGENVPDSELFKGVGAGKLTFESKNKLEKFRDEVAGPQHELIKRAFKAIDEAFAKSMMAEGTPEQAAAHYAAQSELVYAIEEAKQKGDLLDILDPNSKSFILPGIMIRNQLSMQDQIAATKNKIMRDKNDKNGSGRLLPRTPGETPEQYLKRIGGGQ